MEIQEEKHGAVTVVRPMGALVQHDADQLRKVLNEVVPRSLGRLVIDAASIAYVDSKGLEALVTATESLAKAGQTLRLCNANETLREVLELTEVAPMFEHYKDVSDGVRSFL